MIQQHEHYQVPEHSLEILCAVFAGFFFMILLTLVIFKATDSHYDKASDSDDLPFPAPGTSCDLDNNTLDVSAIEGGKAARRKLWPWLVLVKGSTFLCGGTLIAKQWVLSAGHCYDGNVSIAMGFARFSDNPEIVPSRRVFQHKFIQSNDIMLIKLKHPVEYSDAVRPICLPGGGRPTEFKESDYCFVAGWGTQREQYGLPSDVLRYVPVKIIDNTICKNTLSYNMTDKQLCAISANDNPWAGPCIGDSGGPISCRVRGMWYVAGIVSSGIRCNSALRFASPGIYTRVSAFIQWIHKTVREN